MSTDRCEYTPDVAVHPGRGRVSCWRPVHGDTGRCVWHAPPAAKSVEDLASSRSDADDRLDGAAFRGMSLAGVDWLAGAVLVGSDFTNADLSEADLADADLRKSSLRDVTARDASFESANLEDVNAQEADFRGADLTYARLDETNFSDSRISDATAFGERSVYEREVVSADDPDPENTSFDAALRTYRSLESLSEENALYGQAGGYYRKAKDLRRRYNWRAGNYAPAALGEVSRWVAGYGNVPARVVATSLVVILVCGALYPLVGGIQLVSAVDQVTFAVEDPLSAPPGRVAEVLLRSVFFSVVTFTTLGYGNLEPVGTVSQYLAGLEALVGSLLMALLVAVFTRSTWLR